MARSRQALLLLALTAFLAVNAQTNFVKSPETSGDIELSQAVPSPVADKKVDTPSVQAGNDKKQGQTPPVKAADDETAEMVQNPSVQAGNDSSVETAALWHKALKQGKCIYKNKLVACNKDKDKDDDT
jgi:hypothetical protein